ncbi:MAG: thioredoxin [Endozoicomonas sp.]|uniref:thioredoxin n=1 Tax=Endozoicomonas sp. TaxID=1892382 RepID=UPI003D9BDE7B
MSVHELTDHNHFERINNHSDWFLVDFWATWCGPCKVMNPVIEKIGDSYEGQVATSKANVDELQELAKKYGIRGVPTLILFHKGQAVDQLVGSKPEKAVTQWLDNHIAKAKKS